jgi:hypothetical protein
LLGAVLADAEGQQHLLVWLVEEDFYRPWHGQVWAAMVMIGARGGLPEPFEVHQELRTDPNLPPAAKDATLLTDLMAACPRASNARAYAAIVIGGGIRRKLALAGGRLRLAATVGGEPVDDLALESARQAAANALADVRACQRRWELLPPVMRRELQAPARDAGVSAQVARQAGQVRDELARLNQNLWCEPAGYVTERLAGLAEALASNTAVLEQNSPAARAAAREARPSGAAAESAGLAALRDLTAGPSRLDDVAGWLQPGHFARAEHGNVYAVMADLRRAGMEVDEVTVTWEARRRGIAIEPRSLAGGCGAFAGRSAAQVYRRAVLAQVERAGLDLQMSAGDCGLRVPQVLNAADGRLSMVEHELAPGRCRVPGRGAKVVALRPGRRADRALGPAVQGLRGPQPVAGIEREAGS